MGTLATAVGRTLARDWTHRADWRSGYRRLALERQYVLPSGKVAGAQLAFGLRELFGTEYLAELGCDFRSEALAWPALMVRERVAVTFGPVKHLLLDAFLRSPMPRRTVFVYQPPGRQAADLGELDRRLASMVMEEAARLLQAGETGTVTSLLQSTGYWQTFRHKRKLLPMTAAQVEAFKKTAASERRTGGREAHAKRLTAIAEGRQKPLTPWSAREGPQRLQRRKSGSC